MPFVLCGLPVCTVHWMTKWKWQEMHNRKRESPGTFSIGHFYQPNFFCPLSKCRRAVISQHCKQLHGTTLCGTFVAGAGIVDDATTDYKFIASLLRSQSWKRMHADYIQHNKVIHLSTNTQHTNWTKRNKTAAVQCRFLLINFVAMEHCGVRLFDFTQCQLWGWCKCIYTTFLVCMIAAKMCRRELSWVFWC